ncbi:hypothetical protein Pryu01_01238 [Paraliobacillus ryukyuensis]|uniref:Uncharacterized protein n=1 Tax=Paraliobacillus ryukyuensis TaxID=200904 RepID=A0A366EDP3_9BACI|nr:hypothetical protein [Paraliobacillus ryukyuensis]RBO99528.1 hypothetical protein DES48_104204 [Paraliobacillus ryukyuensis]
MKPYIKKQIIKHALQHYIQRPGAGAKDIAKEKRLLEEITVETEKLKERYRIK